MLKVLDYRKTCIDDIRRCEAETPDINKYDNANTGTVHKKKSKEEWGKDRTLWKSCLESRVIHTIRFH